jgi:hypothetical protein
MATEQGSMFIHLLSTGEPTALQSTKTYVFSYSSTYEIKRQ